MGKLTVEEAVSRIDVILDRSEGEFSSEYGRFPNLLEEGDYVLLSKYLDCMDEAKKTSYTFKRGDKTYTTCQIQPSDVGFRLMRRFFQRKGYFGGAEQENQFNAFLGRVEYNPPKREQEFRVSTIQDLMKRGIPFPTDYEEFLKSLGTIAGHYPNYPGEMGICFLPTIYGNVYDKPEGKKNKIGFERIGTHLVNPSAHTLGRLKDITDYEGLIKMWDQSIGNSTLNAYK